MIRNLVIDGSRVSVTLVFTTPACPLREFIVEDCQKAVKQLPGVKTVEVEVTAKPLNKKYYPTNNPSLEPKILSLFRVVKEVWGKAPLR
jgi:ATP-binding protein involved in chromosome partitioning